MSAPGPTVESRVLIVAHASRWLFMFLYSYYVFHNSENLGIPTFTRKVAETLCDSSFGHLKCVTHNFNADANSNGCQPVDLLNKKKEGASQHNIRM